MSTQNHIACGEDLNEDVSSGCCGEMALTHASLWASLLNFMCNHRVAENQSLWYYTPGKVANARNISLKASW